MTLTASQAMLAELDAGVAIEYYLPRLVDYINELKRQREFWKDEYFHLKEKNGTS
jgi:hypothetical protein